MFSCLETGTELNDTNYLYSLCRFRDFTSFQEALRVCAGKPSVVLRRYKADIYVNNYNTDILRAWNANIDI